MPEYLAPGVYVEEIDTGSKPIEGVSTSTSGMVGFTERGPENVLTLVTSFAEFRRIFGGYIDHRTHQDVWYLPHAVEGFFQNGGSRLFITRIIADQAPMFATSAMLTLMDQGDPSTFADTRLVTAAHPGDTVLLAETTIGLANGDRIRLDDGPGVEYSRLAVAGAVVAADTRLCGLRTPLYRNHIATEGVTPVTMNAAAAPDDLATTLTDGVTAGSTVLPLLSRTHADPGDILQIGLAADPAVEYVIVQTIPTDPADLRVTIRQPLRRDHADHVSVDIVVENAPGATQTLTQAVSAGDGLMVLDNIGGIAAPGVVRFGQAAAAETEYHALAPLNPVAVALPVPAYAEHLAVDVVTAVKFPAPAGAAEDTTLQAASVAGDANFTVVNVGSLANTDVTRIGEGLDAEYRAISGAPAGSVITVAPVSFPGRMPRARQSCE